MTKASNDPRITQELLLSLFTYDPETGRLENRVRRSQMPAGASAGSIEHRGYLVVNMFGQPRFAHRLIWLMQTGEWPAGEVDHINRAKGDNRWVNLRDVPKSDNVANAGPRRDNACGVRGVCAWRGRWKAEIVVRGQRFGLGIFDTKEAATEAYSLASDRLRAGVVPAPPAAAPVLPPEPLVPSERVVRDLWMRGMTPTQIGKVTGRSMSSVSNSARRIRAKGHPLPRLKSRPGDMLQRIMAGFYAPQGGGA